MIHVRELGKRYRIHLRRERRDTLREAIVGGTRDVLRGLRSRLPGGQAYPDGWRDLWALKDLSFDVGQGEIVGVIGPNGAGKSTLLKILSRITEPTEGRVEVGGRVRSLLEVGTGFHEELTGRENIQLNGAILGMSRAEIRAAFDEIVDFSGVGAFLDTPVKRYSSGMYLRLAFSVAAHLRPEVLLVDEVLAVGDVEFQKKCLGKMDEVAHQGRTVMFVSHQMNAVQRLCQRCILLQNGRLAAMGPTDRIVRDYLTSATTGAAPRQWLDLSTLPRQGNGEARFVALRYEGPEDAFGRPIPDGPLQVLLRIQSEGRRSVGSLAFTLYDHHGRKLVNVDSLAIGRTIHLAAGENQVRIDIEALHLAPGSYVLGLWLADPLGEVCDYLDDVGTVQVVDNQTEGFGIRPEGAVTCRFTMLSV